MNLDFEMKSIEDPIEDWDEEDQRQYWNGDGHIEFFVIQNHGDTFEVEVLDYSGCAGGLSETLGIEYVITDMWCLNKDPEYIFREGVTYTIHDLSVTWTRGDGWNTDDDVDYDFGKITSHATAIGYLSHKIKMIWWRQVHC
jgi:hypothetical protein